jgi:hypothetical protein
LREGDLTDRRDHRSMRPNRRWRRRE